MRTLIAAVVLLAAACASIQAPPGGPVLTTPPDLIRITPDSGVVRTAPPAVVFRFDRVVSERPQGATDLSSLVLISPSDGLPRVSWGRSALSVRPRRQWLPNTAYTVTILPGLTDLRGNVLAEPITTVFSTGGDIPETTIAGTVFDWLAGRPAPRAVVEAVSIPDSVVFVGRTDSLGHFSLRHLPRGSYRVRGFLDLNNNRALDEREPWDTTMVALTDSARVELLTFVHDTVPPSITQVVATDSVTLRVSFDLPIRPELELTPAMFRVIGADTVALPVTAAFSLRDWEAARRAAGDTLPAAPPAPDPAPPARAGAIPPRAPPATPAAPLPQPSRAPPGREIVLTLAAPVVGGMTYRLTATGVQGMLGHHEPRERTFTPPRTQAVPGTPAIGDPPPPPSPPPSP